jgi:hypothetical protein
VKVKRLYESMCSVLTPIFLSFDEPFQCKLKIRFDDKGTALMILHSCPDDVGVMM